MKRLFIISLLTTLTFSVFAQTNNGTKSSQAEIIDAIATALYKKEKSTPKCYNFTNEIPPEEYIGLPACDLTPAIISGSIQIGGYYYSNDNDSAVLMAKSNLIHTSGKMQTKWQADIYARKSEKSDTNGNKEFITSGQKWGTSLQSNYTIEKGGKNYLFAFASYQADRFSSFDYQTSVATGWGRRWLESKVASLEAEIGPGFKIDERAESIYSNNKTKKSAIIRSAATYKRQLLSTIQFQQNFSAEITASSDQNSKYKSVSSISTKLISSLALKFGFTISHDTLTLNNIEKTRTETSLTLIYSI